MEDFRNIAISLPFLTSRRSLKKFFGMLWFASNIHCFPVNCVSRWHPVAPLGRSLFVPKIVTSCHSYLFKVSRIRWPAMISTTAIISPPTLLWFLTNGDDHLPSLNIELSSFLKLYSIGRCWTTNGTIQNRWNSSPSAFWRMENSTVQLEIQWTLHLGLVGGEHCYSFLSPLSNVITVLVEFALEYISLFQYSHSLLRPFCQLLTC